MSTESTVSALKAMPSDERPASVEVDISGRWDALALSECLIPFHSFLVQFDEDHWVVHAQAPGWRGEQLEDVLAVIHDWHVERGVEEASVRVDGQRSPTRATVTATAGR